MTRSEILFLLFIIVILSLADSSGPVGKIDAKKIVKAKKDINIIQNTLEKFKDDNLRYPTTNEGLDILLKNPNIEKYPNYKKYMRSLPFDPWDNYYKYLILGLTGRLMFFPSDRMEFKVKMILETGI